MAMRHCSGPVDIFGFSHNATRFHYFNDLPEKVMLCCCCCHCRCCHCLRCCSCMLLSMAWPPCCRTLQVTHKEIYRYHPLVEEAEIYRELQELNMVRVVK